MENVDSFEEEVVLSEIARFKKQREKEWSESNAQPILAKTSEFEKKQNRPKNRLDFANDFEEEEIEPVQPREVPKSSVPIKRQSTLALNRRKKEKKTDLTFVDLL